MAELFEIPVTFKNNELSFKAHSVRFGYVNHILVDITGTQITIERDEEGNFRAVGDPEKMKDSKVDLDLVKAVVEVLEKL
jgi:hypothetical protein